MLTLTACTALAAAPAALATGGDEPGEMAKALSSAPARVLAQQALVTLDVTGDAEKARERIDASLESRDREDVDLELLRAADEALDGGDREQAVVLLNRALGGGPVPTGEEGERGGVSEQALHSAGRAYEPNETTQEIVALVAGLALLALAALLLGRRTHRRPSSAGS
jgi:hypothetical protein